MRKTTAPCYRCENRAVGCHGDCERYKEFRAAIEADWVHYDVVNEYKDSKIARSLRERARRAYG